MPSSSCLRYHTSSGVDDLPGGGKLRAVLQVERTRPQGEAHWHERVRRVASHRGDEFVQVGGLFFRQRGTVDKANRRRIRVVDVAPVGVSPVPALLPRPVHCRLDDCGVARTPVEIRHAQAHVRRYVARALEVVRHGEHGLALLRPLTGDDNRFGRVDARQHHVRAAVEEGVGFFGRVKRDAGDAEPEADPRHRERQVGGVAALVVLVAVARAEVGRRREAARFIIDQRTQVADAAGVRRQSGGAARHQLRPFHLAHDVAHVGGRCPGQDVIAGDADEFHIREIRRDRIGVVLEIVRGGEDQLRALIDHLADHVLKRGLRVVGGVQAGEEDHLRAGILRLGVLPAFVMRLAPAVIVLRLNNTKPNTNSSCANAGTMVSASITTAITTARLAFRGYASLLKNEMP